MERKTVYEELLKRTAQASGLESWLDETVGGEKGSTREGNLWASARMLAAGLHHFLRHLIVSMVEQADREAAAGDAQAALDLVPERRAANAADLRRVVEQFFVSQRLEIDDSGTPPKATEPKPAKPRAEKVEPPSNTSDSDTGSAHEPTAADLAAEEKAAAGKGKKKRGKKGEPDAPAPEPAAPAPAAEPGTLSTAELIAEKLVKIGRFPADRPLPPAVIAAWSSEDRQAALDWITDRLNGGQAPPPEFLAARFLEDLDVTIEHDQNAVLTEAGIAFADGVSFESQEEFDALFRWAVGRVRTLRGEEGVAQPLPIDLLLDSDRKIFGEVHAEIARGGTSGTTEAELFRQFEGTFALRMVLDALIACGEVLEAEPQPGESGRVFVAASASMVTTAPDLVEALLDLYDDAAVAERLASEDEGIEASAARLLAENRELQGQPPAPAEPEESSPEELEAARERIRNGEVPEP